MKLGVIGEEMLATAIRLAREHGREVQALHVIRVPLEVPLDAPMLEEEERAEASVAEAKLLGADHDVDGRGRDRPRAGDRPGDHRAGARGRRRPDRARLGAALAAAVAVLLADGRLRPPQGALRGADRRVPAVGDGRGVGGDLSPQEYPPAL